MPTTSSTACAKRGCRKDRPASRARNAANLLFSSQECPKGVTERTRSRGRALRLEDRGVADLNLKTGAPPMSEKPISDLRRRMLEDMAVRKFGEKTRHDYIRHVEAFAKFLGRSPDTATADDVRRFQVNLTDSGVQPPTLNSSAS